MSELLLLLLFFPVVWPWIARYIWRTSISWEEMGLNIALCIMLTGGIWYLGVYSATSDTEVLNGRVTGKERVWTSCEHSYQCNCRQESSCDSKGNCTSHTVCDTCYEHSNDYNWVVHADIGQFTIARVDRQGVHEPPRFTIVAKDQPVALPHHFTNYIKAAPESLFNNETLSLIKEWRAELPPYPLAFYDYHYVNRVIPVGVPLPDLPSWNHELALLLRELGPQKQANVVIVFTKSANPMYAKALEAHWLGGKKNDIVVVLGTPEYPKIAWAGVVSWTDQELFKVELRDALIDLKEVDRGKVLATIRAKTMARFVRKPMADFEYLKYEIEPPLWAMILAIMMAIGGSLGLSFYFKKNDIRLFRR